MPSSFSSGALLEAAKAQIAVITIDMKRFSRKYRGKPVGDIKKVLRKRLPGQSRATIGRMARAIHNGEEIRFVASYRAGRSRARPRRCG